MDGDDSALLELCPRYNRLSDQGRKLVTGYLRVLRRVVGLPTDKEWFDEAGVPRSTAYKLLHDAKGEINFAIAEAEVIFGVRACRNAAHTVSILGNMIKAEFLSGKRGSTATLTSQEVCILRDCMAVGGVMTPCLTQQSRTSVSVQDAKGNSVTLSVDAGGEQDGVSKALLELRARQGWTDGEAFMRGDVAGVQDPSGSSRDAGLGDPILVAAGDGGGACSG